MKIQRVLCRLHKRYTYIAVYCAKYLFCEISLN
uniref:Uncharacterized protein n=1 Tax=Siphoviridae sp. ctsxw88 TaxID=2825701 RepID=A0A8S5PFU3_9CAUD|nr:MAG TPA: hypothetical protein [Siphoviridae sp. ctsxw88]